MLKRLFLSLLLIYSCSSEEEPAPPPAPVKYTLTTAVNPAEGGTITPASGEYNAGTTVTITASPAAEYVFKDWTGATGTTASTSVVMSSNKSVTANFVKKQYPLTVEIQGEGSVDEEVIKQGLATDYNSGTIVELKATPSSDWEGDWEFVEWTGDITSTENPVQITIDGPKTVKAKFMRYFDYSKPSYHYKMNLHPVINVEEIASKFGYSQPEYAAFDTGIAYADFNEDGRVDINLALATGPDGTFVKHLLLLNEGNDNWKDGTDLISNPDFQIMTSRKTIVGDFNGDGKPDVVRPSGAHEYYGYHYILLSGDSGYEFKNLDNLERDSHGVSSGDIDNDGDLDLIFSGTTKPGIVFYVNDGQGNFSSEIKFLRGDEWLWQVDTNEMYDFNNDGNIDLIWGGGYNDPGEDNGRLDGLTILWGSGDGNFSLDNSSEVFGNGELLNMGADDFVFYDLNNDNNLDIINLSWNQSNSRINIFSGSEDYTFTNVTNEWIESSETDKGWVWLMLRDLDKDGYIELYDPSKYNGQKFEWNGSMFVKD